MNKKLCTLIDDDGISYSMLLSNDQIAMVVWLIDKGYGLKIELIPDEPIEIVYDDHVEKAIM